MKTTPLWICRTVAVLCVGTELAVSLSGPAPYEKIRPGMTMDKVYELLGKPGMGIHMATASKMEWDRRRIWVFSVGGLETEASEQKVTKVEIVTGYNRLGWLRYRMNKCYSEVMAACERLKR